MTKRNRIIYWIATVWLALGMTTTGVVQLMKIKEGGRMFIEWILGEKTGARYFL